MAARATLIDSVGVFVLTGFVLERDGRREDVLWPRGSERLRLNFSAVKMTRSFATASFSYAAVIARSCASLFFYAALIARSCFLVG